MNTQYPNSHKNCGVCEGLQNQYRILNALIYPMRSASRKPARMRKGGATRIVKVKKRQAVRIRKDRRYEAARLLREKRRGLKNQRYLRQRAAKLGKPIFGITARNLTEEIGVKAIFVMNEAGRRGERIDRDSELISLTVADRIRTYFALERRFAHGRSQRTGALQI